MKLRIKFVKGFVIPVSIGIIFSLIISITILFVFSYGSVDESIEKKVVQQGTELAFVDTLTVNTLMQKMLLQTKALLEMQINQYIAMASSPPSAPAPHNHFSCLKLSEQYDVPAEKANTTACWFIDNNIKDLSENRNEKKIIDILSHVLQTSIAAFKVESTFTLNYYFAFDEFSLLIYYPVEVLHRQNILSYFVKYNNSLSCMDGQGNYPEYFYYKCRDWYTQMTEILKLDPSRDFFLMSPYLKEAIKGLEMTICKRFTDSISNGNASLCVDLDAKLVFDMFDQLNNNFNGHFLLTAVHRVFPFYFPKMSSENLNYPLAEFEFTEATTYYLEELIAFRTETSKVFIKDYLSSIASASEDPLWMMTALPDPQHTHFFMKNGEVYNYTLYPIIIHSSSTRSSSPYVHIATIVYIYQEKYFLNKLFNALLGIEEKIIIVLVIWGFITFIIISIIYIFIIIMAKFIVIPIKNVGSMLKGINIGGENRLNYIELLQEKANEASLIMTAKTLPSNPLGGDLNIDSTVNSRYLYQNENSNLLQGPADASLSLSEGSESKRDSSEATMRDLISFEFNEEMLEYRPKEINSLVKVLLDLKKVLLLTSKSEENNKREMLIDFSKSESIFEDVKIQEGERICQSNIGNLSASCHKYDLAIYHMALSLQDTQLNKYFSKAITDELDSKGTLLTLLESNFNKATLVKDNQSTQQTKANITYTLSSKLPQKTINALINNRYNKLIYIYYQFFAILSKSTNKTQDLEGLYLHTTYHSVYYFQKILIQYLHLCLASNDIIKIGEAILEYIHFQIKFKLNNKDGYSFSKSNKDVYCELFDCVTYGDIHKMKTAMFERIMQWFDLFDHYARSVKENTILDSDESIMEQYAKNDKSKAGFLFKVIVQRGFYLKGKLAFICKHYLDAIEYFLEASRSDLLVSDGLIKVKALNHLNKITMKLMNKEEKYQYLLYKKKVTAKKELNWTHQDNQLVLQNFKASIDESLSVLNLIREKDVLILIDSNSLQEESDQRNIKEQIEIIISSYLTMSDRVALFYVDEIEKIICPMTLKKELNITELYANLAKINLKKSHNSFDEDDVCLKNQKALSYCLSYLSIKEIEKNEMFCIWFTNGFSGDHLLNEANFFESFTKYANISLFIVGRIDSDTKVALNKVIHPLFNQNSQCVIIDDIKRIKGLLFSKQYITEDFEFPNEVYESHMNQF